jgi:two-component system, NarL family, response regulator DegU
VSIRILIADDHRLLRQGIRNFLSLEADFEIVGEAADGEETVSQATLLQPDVVLLDINMPKANGIEVTRRLREKLPQIRILALTMHDEENYVLEMLHSGAAGYLLKDVEPSMLVQAIRRVYAGESFVEPSLTPRLLRGMSAMDAGSAVAGGTVIAAGGRLSPRETEVVCLVSQGMSNAEIAQTLFLSEKTVKNHLTNIFRKLQVTDRTQAVLYAIKHKIVSVG